MKTLTTVILFLLFYLSIPRALPQNCYIPDDNFESALIVIGCDTGPLNDSVPISRIDTLKELVLPNGKSGHKISDLTGVEYFKSLSVLVCRKHLLKKLDVRHNKKLTRLDCGYNQIEELKLDSLFELNTLICNNNDLVQLDLSSNRALVKLECKFNNIVQLNLESNSSLASLKCNNNQLESIHLKKSSALTSMHCQYNLLSFLDLSQCAGLKSLNCSNNLITMLDLSRNNSLKWLKCNNNRLRTLNIRNGNNSNMTGEFPGGDMKAANNPELTCIEVDNADAVAGFLDWEYDSIASYSEDCNKLSSALDMKQEVRIYPNPWSDRIIVDGAKPKTIEIFDVKSKLVYKKTDATRKMINIAHLVPGLYFIRIIAENGNVYVRKLIRNALLE